MEYLYITGLWLIVVGLFSWQFWSKLTVTGRIVVATVLFLTEAAVILSLT